MGLIEDGEHPFAYNSTLLGICVDREYMPAPCQSAYTLDTPKRKSPSSQRNAHVLHNDPSASIDIISETLIPSKRDPSVKAARLDFFSGATVQFG